MTLSIHKSQIRPDPSGQNTKFLRIQLNASPCGQRVNPRSNWICRMTAYFLYTVFRKIINDLTATDN